MKRILLLLSLLLAPSAFADDAVTSFGWNSVTSTFQAKLAALGWKNIPDEVTVNGTLTPSVTQGGGSCSGCALNYTTVRHGRTVTIMGTLTTGTITGTAQTFSVTLPGITVSSYTPLCFSDFTAATLFYMNAVSGTATVRFGLQVMSNGTQGAFSTSQTFSVTCKFLAN